MKKFFYKEMRTITDKDIYGFEFIKRTNNFNNFNFDFKYEATKGFNVIKVNGKINETNLIRLTLTTKIDFYYYFTAKKITGDFTPVDLPENILKEFGKQNVIIDIASYFKGALWINLYVKNKLTIMNNHFDITVNDKESKRIYTDFQMVNYPLMFDIHTLAKGKLFSNISLKETDAANLNHLLYLKEFKKFYKKSSNYNNLLKEIPKVKDVSNYLDYLDLLDPASSYTEELVMALI